MATKTPYKLGLCPCGNLDHPCYISTSKHGLENEFLGTYYVSNAEQYAITLLLDTSGKTVPVFENEVTSRSLSNLKATALIGANGLHPVPKRQAPTPETQTRNCNPATPSQVNFSEPSTSTSIEEPPPAAVTSKPVQVTSNAAAKAGKSTSFRAVKTVRFQLPTDPIPITPRPESLTITNQDNSPPSNSSTNENADTPRPILSPEGTENTNAASRNKGAAPKPPVVQEEAEGLTASSLEAVRRRLKPITISPAPPAPPPPPTTSSTLPTNTIRSISKRRTISLPNDLKTDIHSFNKNSLNRSISLNVPKTQPANMSPQDLIVEELKKRAKAMRPRSIDEDDDTFNDSSWA